MKKKHMFKIGLIKKNQQIVKLRGSRMFGLSRLSCKNRMVLCRFKIFEYLSFLILSIGFGFKNQNIYQRKFDLC